jgi:hypothetical protein
MPEGLMESGSSMSLVISRIRLVGGGFSDGGEWGVGWPGLQTLAGLLSGVMLRSDAAEVAEALL